jgi:integrative and conjugative element protein (TIGR02256 family)
MNDWMELFGAVCRIEDLQVEKARQFALFLSTGGVEGLVRLEEVRRIDGAGPESIIAIIEVERPQDCRYPVNREEKVAVLFSMDDQNFPEVYILREDFPLVPHLNITPEGWPKSPCLYAEPFPSVRLQWTPARYLRRLQHWFAGTANGDLHGRDQPLEPLLFSPEGWFVLPRSMSDPEPLGTGMVGICRIEAKNGEKPVLFPCDGRPGKPSNHLAVGFRCLPQEHGVIANQPANLESLNNLCRAAGLELVTQLRERLRSWQTERPVKGLYDARLVIVLFLPKSREKGGAVEETEVRAFLTLKSVGEIGVRTEAFQRVGGEFGAVLAPREPDSSGLREVELLMLNCLSDLDHSGAAVLNGTQPVEDTLAAIGAGALGSQVIANLVRSGIWKWKVFDGDVFLPHNSARHFLGREAIGLNKAAAVCDAVRGLLAGTEIVSIPQFVGTGKPDATGAGEFSGVKLVCDFAASIPVSRWLAHQQELPRCLTAFLSPTGRTLVILLEDALRQCRLDWMEMLHYRAILEQESLRECLQSPSGRIRYGTSCRDVSLELPQDLVAMWAAFTSRFVREHIESSGAVARMFSAAPDGGVCVTKLDVHATIRHRMGDWAIILDKHLLSSLTALREAGLPDETGGVLIGAFDTANKRCYVVSAISSPRDSIATKQSYVRGIGGLRAKISEIERVTQGQLGYVGEWHSHPAGCSTQPSLDDRDAHEWLVGIMQPETLPGIMFIIGERDWRLIVG